MAQRDIVGPRHFLWLILSIGCAVLVVTSSSIVAEDLGTRRAGAAVAASLAGLVLAFVGYLEHYHARRRFERNLAPVPRPAPGVDETTEQREFRLALEAERREERIQAGEDMWWAVLVMAIGFIFASYAGLVYFWQWVAQRGAAATAEAP